MKQSSLFESASKEIRTKNAPLAYRMRPENMDEFVGQEHILGEGKLLRRLIETDTLGSIIFFGPPGTGKTTMANIIARITKSNFYTLNAIEAKKEDVKTIISEAKKNMEYYQQKTILFVDEIHRFNKAQQDVLLKDVEEGSISLIGSTTANPLYSLNSALVSRSRVFEFKPLSTMSMLKVIKKALVSEKGLLEMNVDINDEDMKLLVKRSDGDLRQVLNNLEFAVKSTIAENGKRLVTKEIIEEATAFKSLNYDENEHYDNISAFIKSMRASNPDQALHYMARMLKGGEDPLFIARRMVIFASEDIGLANPEALQLALSVYRACEVLGMPECRINLGHGTVYLAKSAKSRESYEATESAIKRVEELPNNPVPDSLRNYRI